MHYWSLWAFLQLAIEEKVPVAAAKLSQNVCVNSGTQHSSSQEEFKSNWFFFWLEFGNKSPPSTSWYMAEETDFKIISHIQHQKNNRK